MPARKKIQPATVVIADRLPFGLIDCLISSPVAYAAMDLSKTSAARLARTDPSFPKKRMISPRRAAFVASEVVMWIRSRPAIPADMPRAALDALAAKREAARRAH